MGLLVLPVLSLLLLAAHFVRADLWLMVILVFLTTSLLAFPRPWAAHLVRVALFAGALVWLRALVAMATIRWTMDLPFMRLVIILGAVMLLTLGSIFVFRHPRVRRFYRLVS